LWQVAADLCEAELEDVGAVAKNSLSPEPLLCDPAGERGGEGRVSGVGAAGISE